jgi:homeobox protein cut-like
VKIAEIRDLDVELQRLRDENADLRKHVSEFATIEAAKKKVDVRVEQLEQKVRDDTYICD